MSHQSDPQKPRTFKQLLKVPAFRVYFTFSVVLILILIGLIYWSIPDDKDLRSTLRGQKSEIKELHTKIDRLKRVIKADETALLTENYNKARSEYEALTEDLTEEEQDIALSERIKQMNRLIEEREERDEQADSKSYTINKQNKTIDRLEKNIDSIKTRFSRRQDSLLAKTKDLKQQVKNKEKELSKKERIQAITFKSSNGSTVHYLGEVENGKANGGGVGIWTSGSVYRGDWKNNKRHGEGKMENDDGESYEGEWVNDVRQGEGTYRWPSGERYEGEWADNKRNGHGILYDRDSNIQFEGKWKNDKPVRD